MNVWDELKRLADHYTYDEQPLVELDGLSPDEIDGLRNQLTAVKKAAALLDKHLLAALQEHLGEKGYVRFGPTVYRAGRDRDWKLKRENQAEFWKQVYSTPRMAEELFNPNDARITGLRTLADVLADRGWCHPETGEVGWDAFEDWFLDVVDRGAVVSVMPADRSPQFIQNTPSGEVVKR